MWYDDDGNAPTGFMNIMKETMTSWKYSEPLKTMARRLVNIILVQNYKSSVQQLVSVSTNANESTNFSLAISETSAKFGWSKVTLAKVMTVVRRILGETTLDAHFINMIKILAPNKTYNKIIGRKWGCLEETHRARIRLESWIKTIRENTTNRSDLSIRNMMTFYTSSCLPKLGLDINNWEDDTASQVT
jgi:hypothetical protein